MSNKDAKTVGGSMSLDVRGEAQDGNISLGIISTDMVPKTRKLDGITKNVRVDMNEKRSKD